VLKVAYTVSLGGLQLDSAADPRTELLAVDVFRSMNAAADYCRVTLYAPPAPQPDLLTQAIGAAASALGFGEEAAAEEGPSIAVRGETIRHGAPIEISLAVGDQSARVMTAEVDGLGSSLERTTLVGRSALQKLAATRLNAVYQNQSTGQIVRDAASQAGVQVGQVAAGTTWPYLVIDETRPLFRHLRDLARREDCDLFVDDRDRLTLAHFDKTAPDHTFHYGIDLLALELRRDEPALERTRVYGDSPASSEGTTAWPWLIKDPAPLGGAAGEGLRVGAWRDGAVRTKDAADRLATARLGAAKDGSSSGRLVLPGAPSVAVGDAIEIRSAPQPELNGLFKVTAVRHLLAKDAGYVTHVWFSGQGGSAQAGDLLGALAGQLAGAVGL
jgi:hypothetical protein